MSALARIACAAGKLATTARERVVTPDGMWRSNYYKRMSPAR